MMPASKRYFFLFVLLSFNLLVFSQNRVALLVAEYRIDTPRMGNYTYLTRYHFNNGQFVSKDTVFGSDVYDRKRMTSVNCARFDLNDNTIYQNRYVITGTGDLIDLKTRSLANDGDRRLIEPMGDSILYNEGWGMAEQSAYLFFNLKTREFHPVADSTYFTQAAFYAPDHRHSIETAGIIEGTVHYNKSQIILHSIDDSSRIVVNHISPTYRTMDITMGFPDIPVIWIDSENFVFADHRILYNKEAKKIKWVVFINRLNITTMKRDTIGSIDHVEADRSNGLFKMDQSGGVRYYCQKGVYTIDLMHKTVLPIQYEGLGYGFKEDYYIYKKKSKLYYQDTAISKCDYYGMPATVPGYVAKLVAETPGTSSDASYVCVWNTITKKWIRCAHVPWVAAMVGWIQE